jgi:hypothetical protein
MPREIVTSENREEYNDKKMAQRAGKSTKKSEKNEEFDPKKIKSFMRKYRKNEDRNAHSENTVELAKFLGHKEHEETAKEIMDRHEKRGYLDDEDSNKRRAIDKELWPRVEKYYSQQK